MRNQKLQAFLTLFDKIMSLILPIVLLRILTDDSLKTPYWKGFIMCAAIVVGIKNLSKRNP